MSSDSDSTEFSEMFRVSRLPRRSEQPPTADELLQKYFPGAFPGSMEQVVEQRLEEPAPTESLIQTLSLVRLHLDQGYVSEARRILQQIVAAQPDNVEARAQLDALSSESDALPTVEESLSHWLGAIEMTKEMRGLPLLR